MKKWFLLGTHGVAVFVGFALGIYMLPILTAPKAPESAVLETIAADALYTTEFTRDLKGSDFLHWGEGKVSIAPTQIAHTGKLAPGPDYKLYLVPEFVEDEASFLAIKDQAQEVGDIKTFDGFMVDIPAGVDINAYTTVIVWCESFSEFITAAKYR